MRHFTRAGVVTLAIVVGAALALQGCSGNGGGGGGGSPTLLLITTETMAAPLWQSTSAGPVVPPVCLPGVFVNSRITLTFAGAVEETSLPQFGLAEGSINIVTTNTHLPAQGTFSVEDDPTLPAGNHRRVVFTPTIPSDPNAPCAAGLQANVTYNVNVPMAGVVVDASPLENSAMTCFVTCGCPDSLVCASPFTDPVSGPPYVVTTTPATSDPAPSPIDPATVNGNTIQILVSEALNPAGIDLTSVRVVNIATGAQVPGSLVFHQTGSPGFGIQSQIDYVASHLLLANVTYQILLGPGITDFGGNPLQTSQSNPSAQLFFQTFSPLCAQPPLVETFDTTTNLESISGALQWSGNGVLQATFPLDLTGDGSDGAFNPPVIVPPTVIDTNEIVNGQSRQGKWNFTSVNIPMGATVRIVGPYLSAAPLYGAGDGQRDHQRERRNDEPVDSGGSALRHRPRAREQRRRQHRPELRGPRRARERGRGLRWHQLGHSAPAGQPADLPVPPSRVSGRSRLRTDDRRHPQHRRPDQPALCWRTRR